MTDYTGFDRLSDTLDILRRDCPWDREQTFDSLRYLTIEEVYELSEAILALQQADTPDDKTVGEVKKELGDILMHVLFYSKIAEDERLFTFDEVCHAVCDKLESRHPHLSLPLSDGTLRPPLTDTHPGWEQVKMREGRRSVFDGVPRALPSLVKAVRLQEKAEGMGYTDAVVVADSSWWQQLPVDETAVGDFLFAWCRWLRSQGVNADEALAQANQRYMQRVEKWESDRKGDSLEKNP